MCGVAGIARIGVGARPPTRQKDADTVYRMLDTIAHRGPDGRGVESLLGGAVTLGHVRLAIIDREHGFQPRIGHRFAVAWNGELYDHPFLRAELGRAGVVFETRSDTETIVAAFDAWEDPARLTERNAMFALAAVDLLDGVLYLSRDGFGQKPLYYARDGDRLIFASEVKAIFAAGFRAELDPDAVAEYLTFQNLLDPDASLWRGIRQVPRGAARCFPLDGGPAFDFYGAERTGKSITRDARDEVREAFDAAIATHLVADVPVGAYLSGGMDSGAIVASASKQRRRLKTFTVGFDLAGVGGREAKFDERDAAEAVAHHYQTEHYTRTLRPDDVLEQLSDLTWHLDDPRLGQCHQNFAAAKLAAGVVKVVLSGVGGDELFAGYPWRYTAADDALLFRQWHRLVPMGELPALLSPELASRLLDVRERFIVLMEQCRAETPAERALWFEEQTFLPGLLHVEDRLSMAFGLEVRAPFLDQQVVELARACRLEQKLRGGVGKIVLREAFAKDLPPGHAWLQKQGFSPPDEAWFRGPVAWGVSEILRDKRTRERGLFDQKEVDRRLEEHFSGAKNHRLLIWSLLSLEMIQRHFVDGASATREAA